ncbi:AfsR/SARP family transcriptional regulator [Actinophytocola algeriensis]|uniref:DNA-binding SARP family transcriptional activator/tetratricopeptide (TPR) repeat protein n=1 Tax=Actinophytocola algeriensis TaxID=1768010 RepID=A0A7W7Q870_9PSEU|nr:AfsR/SARP family transcriptional regulator [Actinophytocola algeriensis]MBB4908658.1 DNA-binding SARP family transcriptional activator/tetratricopeptide (TPR) repeat protein [Actinophytocola algeriensis]MBE1474955.1 DNA-binding SARP family transcriptional activator/tetratricopeptide (TPR) repeat protein [Actinophytocola algeriensis]
MAVVFRILGRLEVSEVGTVSDVEDAGDLGVGTPIAIAGGHARQLLGVLLLHEGRLVGIDTLAEVLWDDDPPPSCRKLIQARMSQLRRSLGAVVELDGSRDGYRLTVRAGTVDLREHRALVRDAASGTTPADTEVLLDRALSLWHWPALAELAGTARGARIVADLTEEYLATVEAHADAALASGRCPALAARLAPVLDEHPLRERIRAQLMRALHRAGRQADALAVFDRGRRLLADELGVDPGQELRAAHAEILAGDDPAGPAVRTEPVAPVPRQLPPALGDFTGQWAELAEIEAVLRAERAHDEPAAVVTVSGLGGIGKTALAVQAGHRLKTVYTDGQLFAVLGGARAQPVDPAIVLGRFLRALGVPATAVPDDPEERGELYRSLLAERRVLVVLDDVLDEAQLAPLLPASGTCGVLVTGRVRLGALGGARRVVLGEMSEADSVALLRNSTDGRLAAAADAELSALVGLCARLPLALRIVGSLLASRPHWRLADLVSRLADEQHRLDALRYRDLEVRASFGLSYAGLRPAAGRLFRLLGLLEAPDFPLWAAAAVVDSELGAAQDLLDELVDVHLLDVTGTPHGQARYGFHDLLRAYARERAEAEEPAAGRHAAVVRALGALLAFTDIADRDHMGQNMFQRDAPRWRPDLVGASLPPDVLPMTVLDTERTALVAAVRQAADLGRDELCCELAVGGQALFETERYFDDWQTCYDTAMDLARTAGNLRGQARLLISMAGLRYLRRRYGPAEEANTEAMHLFERIGDQRGYLEALSNAPFFLVPNGRLTEAITAGGEAFERLTANGQAAAALHAYSQVGLAHLQAGRPGTAVAVLAEIVAGAREQGIRTLVARDTYWLGQAELALGHQPEAEKAFTELSAHVDDIGPSGDFYAAHAWGCLHLARGEYADARRRLLEGVEIARGLHDPLFEARVLVELLDLHLRDGDDLPAAISLGEHAVGVARGINYPYLLAGILDKLARLHTATGDDTAADRLAGEAATLYAGIR